MLRLAEYTSVGTGTTGVFCQIIARNYITVPAASGVIDQPPQLLVSGTLYATGLSGLTSGSLVPVFLGPDGNWYPLAAASSPTAAGFIFNFQQTTPVPGLAIQVLTGTAGGGLYLSVIAAQL